MITTGFWEILTDALTTNPELSGIPTASSILDTSNYTFYAVSLGKDGQGFTHHAHTVSSELAGVYNSGYVLFRRYNSVSPSSYHVSSTHSYFSSTYNSIPSYPSPYDTRLERKSTSTNIEGHIDNGQYINAAIDPTFSSVWNVIGGYPPSGNMGKYMLVTSGGTFICSGNLSGVFNTNQVVDRYGFIRLNPLTVTDIASLSVPFSGGPLVAVNSSTFSSTAQITMSIGLQLGDAAALEAFGGINHIGVWALDLKEMLASGINPPYSWNNVNTNRKYKLIGKVTMWTDPLIQNDILAFPGFKSFLESGLQEHLSNLGPVISLIFNF